MDWTYFIQSGENGPIKIGMTQGDAVARLRNLQVGCPEKLAILGIMAGNQEAALHALFEADHVQGEWFRPSAKLVTFIRKNASPAVEMLESYGPGQVDVSGPLAEVFAGMYRRRDGKWMFVIYIDGETILADGRRIRISRHVGVPATEQIGRRRAMA